MGDERWVISERVLRYYLRSGDPAGDEGAPLGLRRGSEDAYSKPNSTRASSDIML